MKYTITESQYGNIIDKFITHQFEPHKEKRTREYPNSIFWLKDGEIIAQIENPDYFWINPQIWTNIMSMFSLKHTETRQVIKDWLEEHYKLGELKPFTKYTLVVIGLEEH
jgi:hypothetical protein